MQEGPPVIGEFYFTSPFVINQRIYTYWIEGYNVSQTTAIMQKKLSKKTGKGNQSERTSMESWKTSEETYHKLIFNQVSSQYRFFEKVKPLLAEPFAFDSSPLVYNIFPSLKRMLIEKYFTFDSSFMREIIGKKLNPRIRKELDEIHEKSKITLSSCKRQLENLYQISKEIREVETSRNDMISFIQKEFLLSETMANKYGRILFLCHFQMDTTKRKLRDFTFEEFEYMAQIMIKYWTDSKDVFKINLDYNVLRELKGVFAQNDRREEFKNIVHLTCKNIDSKMIHLLLKNLTMIGSGLVSPKEFQDFFIDIFENVIQPLAKLRLKEEESKLFLNTLLLAVSKMKKMNAFITHWENFMSVVRDFYMVLYPNSY